MPRGDLRLPRSTCLPTRRKEKRPSVKLTSSPAARKPWLPAPRARALRAPGKRAPGPPPPQANATLSTLTPPTTSLGLVHRLWDRRTARKYAGTLSSERFAAILPARLEARCGGSLETLTLPDATRRYATHTYALLKHAGLDGDSQHVPQRTRAQAFPWEQWRRCVRGCGATRKLEVPTTDVDSIPSCTIRPPNATGSPCVPRTSRIKRRFLTTEWRRCDCPTVFRLTVAECERCRNSCRCRARTASA